ncbi:YceI family protein [Methylomicrobium sp. RS1]|jgi:polyisoprenoid-binding protein YceI|uniref:YceI family protein n=1 Tax=Candidatus Methylomicrobium oryzae TaxID=2802053 RepID=UPI001922CF8C|nr:YceI family protein [Methylomicrobium sp. RS1]MBL1264399.1 polyisoprenoid-binding protein [Methylomicrobium sp. RS1]
MIRLLFALFAAAVSAVTSTARAETYTVDPRHTFPSFEIDHLGFSIQRGRFNQTEGKIALEPASPAGGSIDVAIDAASISTGLPELEKHLRGEDFLDVARFPKILFKSKQLIFDNQGQLIGAKGELTLHGVTKPVHLAVDRFHCGMNLISMKNVCGANATATIKRSDFGVDKYAPALADEVNVIIQIEAIRD